MTSSGAGLQKPKRVMFHVQHLLGSGHLHRAARLARALDAAGFEVTLVSGGVPVAGIDTGGARLLQLPPARAADASFSLLLDASGAPLAPAWHAARKAMLLDIFEECQPDALIIEMFPFGRRQFAFELMPLLDAAWARAGRPLIAASVRDIIFPSRKAGRIEEAMARLRSCFDHVLVHGDPAFLPLTKSFPAAAQIEHMLVYTGYVAPAAPAPGTKSPHGRDEIIVSAGGGAAGNALMRAAIMARGHSKLAGSRVWRLLIGALAPVDTLRRLRDQAGDGFIVETARPDFPAMLYCCACSVSQAGYNSVVEIVQAGARAVLAPFDDAKEQEQTLRAAALASAGRAVVVAGNRLTPESLARAIDTALLNPVPALNIDLNGASATVQFLTQRLQHATP